MCGRGDQTLTWPQIYHLLEIIRAEPADNLQPNYNVAPTHEVLLCSLRDGARVIERMVWGLIPAWAREPLKYSTINAKAETIEEKATWKASLGKMRCVVPFTGFYEWKRTDGKKQPFRITRRDGEPMLLAGLWAYNDRLDPDGVRSFAIITCEANASMGMIHDRMPVVLSPEDVDIWLDGEPWSERHRALLRPCPDEWLTASPVSPAVGNVRNNGPELLKPIGDPIF